MAAISDYTDLITSQHSGRPKFMAMVGLVAGAFVDTINALAIADFDIDTAIGAQLDRIGEWVGLSRFVPVPLAIYFSFNIAGLGFNQGVWFGQFSPPTGLVALDDDSYRRLLYAKIGINTWDSTVLSFNAIMATALAGTGATATAIDNLDMTMTVRVSSNIPLVLKSLFDSGVFIPKPAGVSVTLTYV